MSDQHRTNLTWCMAGLRGSISLWHSLLCTHYTLYYLFLYFGPKLIRFLWPPIKKGANENDLLSQSITRCKGKVNTFFYENISLNLNDLQNNPKKKGDKK